MHFKLSRSKDVPWRINCQRLVDHVYVSFSFLAVKLGRGRSRHWIFFKGGRQNNDEVVQPEKTKGETWVEYQIRTNGQEDVGAAEIVLSV